MGTYVLNYMAWQLPAEFVSKVSSNTLDAKQNAFLNRFGKIVVTFFQKKEGDTVVLMFNRAFEERLREHLKMHMKLSGVAPGVVDGTVYFDTGSGEMHVSEEQMQGTMTKDEFDQYRRDTHIPLQGFDYDQEMVLNVGPQFTSLTKGCYPGQEVVARVSNLGKPPKKLVVREGKFVFIANT